MAQTAMTVHLDNDSVREQAKAAFRELRKLAVESTEPELSLDEINEEIKAARLEISKGNEI
jgi:hypothetical protein